MPPAAAAAGVVAQLDARRAERDGEEVAGPRPGRLGRVQHEAGGDGRPQTQADRDGRADAARGGEGEVGARPDETRVTDGDACGVERHT